MNMEHYLEQLNLTEMMAELDGYFTGFSWNMQEIFGQILKGNFRETLEMAGDGIRQGIWAELGDFGASGISSCDRAFVCACIGFYDQL